MSIPSDFAQFIDQMRKDIDDLKTGNPSRIILAGNEPVPPRELENSDEPYQGQVIFRPPLDNNYPVITTFHATGDNGGTKITYHASVNIFDVTESGFRFAVSKTRGWKGGLRGANDSAGIY